MLRKSKSIYESGRSSTLLKVKNYNEDEAIIKSYSISNNNNNNNNNGIDIADCEMWTGDTFKLPILNKMKPPIGSVITFRFSGFHQKDKDNNNNNNNNNNNKTPKNVSFIQTRSDLDWMNDVLSTNIQYHFELMKQHQHHTLD